MTVGYDLKSPKLLIIPMSRSRFVIFFLVSFFGGVALASFGQFWLLVIFCFLLLGANFLKLFRRFFVDEIFRKIVICIFSGLIFGFARYFFSLPNFSVGDLGYYRDLGMRLKVQGNIVAEPDVRDDRQYITLGAQKIFFQQQWRDVAGKLLIKAQRFPEFQYGDSLEIEGLLISPPQFEKFSYADVLAKEDVYVVCYKAKINFLRPVVLAANPQFSNVSNVDPFWSLVFSLKGVFSSRINQIFPEPMASLVAGLLFGLRRSIPADILDDFNRAGLTHVLAISGYNINLMIAVFGFFLASTGRRTRFFGMLTGIVFFLLFTGFSGSVIRAAWMGFFLILSTANGRKSQAFLNLMLSGFVMVFLNPRVLIFDLSFELSFLATLGIVVGMPFLENFFAKWPAWIAEGLAVTLAAQIFTTPLILYYFGRFSLIAPVANIFVLPLVPMIMLFSFFALVMAFIFMPLANFLVALSWILLKIMLVVVHIFAHIPFASIKI